MNICVMGHTGFLGSAVYEILSKQFDNVIGISSKDNDCSLFFDAVVNCAGVSARYLVARYPDKAYTTEKEIARRIEGMSFERLIHVSSVCATVIEEAHPYNLMKLYMENRYREIVQPTSRLVVIRPGGMVGKGIKKNVVFDILNDKPIFVTADSIHYYISTDDIANIISLIIKDDNLEGIIDVAGDGSVTVKEICQILEKKPKQFGTMKEEYSIGIDKLKTFFQPKSSAEYIKEIKCLYEKEE